MCRCVKIDWTLLVVFSVNDMEGQRQFVDRLLPQRAGVKVSLGEIRVVIFPMCVSV